MRDFRRRKRQPGIEQELRDARPTPKKDFVRMLADRTRDARRPVPRRLAPKVALAAALTALVLAAVAAAGGVSQAGASLHGVRTAFTSLVSTQHATVSSQADVVRNVAQPTTGAVGSEGGVTTFDAGDTRLYSYRDQYGFKLPVCHEGHTLWLPIPAWIVHVLHGDRPGVCGSDEDRDRDHGNGGDNDDNGNGNGH